MVMLNNQRAHDFTIKHGCDLQLSKSLEKLALGLFFEVLHTSTKIVTHHVPRKRWKIGVMASLELKVKLI